MTEETISWYALKAFYNRTAALEKKVSSFGVETYIPMQTLEKYDSDGLHYEEKPLVNSLIFIRCKESWLTSFKRDNPDDFMFYSSPGSKRPGPIDDEEMRMFMFVTSADRGRNLHYFGESDSTFKTGQRVRWRIRYKLTPSFDMPPKSWTPTNGNLCIRNILLRRNFDV